MDFFSQQITHAFFLLILTPVSAILKSEHEIYHSFYSNNHEETLWLPRSYQLKLLDLLHYSETRPTSDTSINSKALPDERPEHIIYMNPETSHYEEESNGWERNYTTIMNASEPLYEDRPDETDLSLLAYDFENNRWRYMSLTQYHQWLMEHFDSLYHYWEYTIDSDPDEYYTYSPSIDSGLYRLLQRLRKYCDLHISKRPGNNEDRSSSTGERFSFEQQNVPEQSCSFEENVSDLSRGRAFSTSSTVEGHQDYRSGSSFVSKKRRFPEEVDSSGIKKRRIEYSQCPMDSTTIRDRVDECFQIVQKISREIKDLQNAVEGLREMIKQPASTSDTVSDTSDPETAVQMRLRSQASKQNSPMTCSGSISETEWPVFLKNFPRISENETPDSYLFQVRVMEYINNESEKKYPWLKLKAKLSSKNKIGVYTKKSFLKDEVIVKPYSGYLVDLDTIPKEWQQFILTIKERGKSELHILGDTPLVFYSSDSKKANARINITDRSVKATIKLLKDERLFFPGSQ